MIVAIDINDVLRDYSTNFLKYYLDLYNHEFDLSEFEFFDKDMKLVLPFQNDESYYRFVYEDYSFELFAKCPSCGKNASGDLKGFIKKCREECNGEVILVSGMEYGSSLGCTYFFVSKLNPDVREVYMPNDSLKIWDRCDVLITADPTLLNNKPEGKIAVKINTDYNKECDADYAFSSFKKAANDDDFLDSIVDPE